MRASILATIWPIISVGYQVLFLLWLDNEINGIYKVSHFLKMKSLRMTVAAFMACKVYVPLDVLAFNAKKAELGVKNELTPEKSNEFKAKYTFLAV